MSLLVHNELTAVPNVVDNLNHNWFFGFPSSSKQTTKHNNTTATSQQSSLHVSASEPSLSRFATAEKTRRSSSFVRRRNASTDALDTTAASSSGAGTSSNARPPSARPPRPEGRSTQKHRDYAERRNAWRSRLEAAIAPPPPKIYTVQIPSRSRGPSVTSTPSGSPKPPSIQLNGGGGGDGGSPSPIPPKPPPMPLPGSYSHHHAIPAVWINHSADHAPVDFNLLSPDALKLFLQQAHTTTTAAAAAAPRPAPGEVKQQQDQLQQLQCIDNNNNMFAALVAAAHACRTSWEVERIVVGCALPEDVLRVPRGCSDCSVLKGAWKKVALVVHPDRCAAEGAADAMAIAKDAFELLMMRAEKIKKLLNSTTSPPPPPPQQQQQQQQTSSVPVVETNAFSGNGGNGSNGVLGVKKQPGVVAVEQIPNGTITTESLNGNSVDLSNGSSVARVVDQVEVREAPLPPPKQQQQQQHPPLKLRVKLKLTKKEKT